MLPWLVLLLPWLVVLLLLVVVLLLLLLRRWTMPVAGAGAGGAGEAAELPDGWVAVPTDGGTYYENTSTGETQWEVPT